MTSTSVDGATPPAADRRWRNATVLSVALLFFTLPHTLEDFALGEPQKQGVPVVVISTVVSLLVATQAVGLYWLGRRQELGLWVHAALGVLWPLAAGIAQLPVILAEGRYRAGFTSAGYVFGIILVGTTLFLVSAAALRSRRRP